MRDFSQTLAERSNARLQTLSGHLKVGLQTQTLPFSAEGLENCFDVNEHAFLEVKQNSRVYPLACAYIAANGPIQSLRYAGEIDAESSQKAGLKPEDSYM